MELGAAQKETPAPAYPGCGSRLEKSIVRPSSRGGVPLQAPDGSSIREGARRVRLKADRLPDRPDLLQPHGNQSEGRSRSSDDRRARNEHRIV